MTALTVSHASRRFLNGCQTLRALEDCSFVADRGDVIGVVGPNGAGKTTLLRVIAGEVPLSSGSVSINGRRAGTRQARRTIGYVSDPPQVPAELTGVEWLKYLAGHRAANPVEKISLVRRAIELGELEPFAGRRVGHYSRGMVQRLSIAAAGVIGKAAVLLDEALSGVDPLVSSRLRSRIADLAGSGRVVVIASHDLSTV